mgnify:CR=1 FL=1
MASQARLAVPVLPGPANVQVGVTVAGWTTCARCGEAQRNHGLGCDDACEKFISYASMRAALQHIADADPGPTSDQSLAHDMARVAKQAV